MKALKLTLLFVAIVAVIVGAFYVFSGDDSKSHRTRTDDTTFKEYRAQFTKDWQDIGDWDEALFRSHCETLRQLSTDHDVEALRDMNSKSATEIVYKKIFDEWKSPQCRKDVVDKYAKAVKVIESEDPNASADPNIKKIKKVDGVYQSAYSLAHQGMGLRPRFDGRRWNSFSGYATSMKNKQREMLGNETYKEYLSNIIDIKGGLDKIPSKVDAARSPFYRSLAGEIRSYYSRIGRDRRTGSQLQNLRGAVSRYNNEYGSNGSLSSLVREYSSDVSRNEQ